MIIGAPSSATLRDWTSGSEGGFAESNSPVVLASGPVEMMEAIGSFEGGIDGASWDVEAAAPALESLRRLLATIVAQVGRRTSE